MQNICVTNCCKKYSNFHGVIFASRTAEQFFTQIFSWNFDIFEFLVQKIFVVKNP